MKKSYIFVALLLMMIFPIKIFALNASVDMTCNNTGLPSTGVVNCTISATTDAAVTGFHAVLSFSDDINITNFALDSKFTVFDPIVTSTSPITIDAVAVVVEGQSEPEGNFTIATFDVSPKEGATSATQQMILSSVKFYDINVNTVNVEGNKTITFADYLTILNYNKDSTNNIIYGLSCPMTINNFLNNISSNAPLVVLGNNNAALELTDLLTTGSKIRATYRSGEVEEYTVSLIGDVMGEGTISVNGARKISRHIIDKNVITGDVYLMAADYDRNDVIKMNDVVKMLKSMQQ